MCSFAFLISPKRSAPIIFNSLTSRWSIKSVLWDMLVMQPLRSLWPNFSQPRSSSSSLLVQSSGLPYFCKSPRTISELILSITKDWVEFRRPNTAVVFSLCLYKNFCKSISLFNLDSAFRSVRLYLFSQQKMYRTKLIGSIFIES